MSFRHLAFVFRIYLFGLLFFTVFRLLLLFQEHRHWNDLPEKWGLIANGLLIGFRFDTVVSGYLLILPLAIISLSAHFPHKAFVSKGIVWYLKFLYGLAIFIVLADLPYFHHYFSRITTAIFQWTDSPTFMILMVVQDWNYYFYFALFFLSIWLLFSGMRKIRGLYENRFFSYPKTARHHLILGGTHLFCLALCLLAIRGRIAEKSPIRVGTAYFSNYAFPNQLGLNPVFTLLRSFLDDLKPENQEIHLCYPDSAIAYVRNEFEIKDSISDYPLARWVKGSGGKKYNVVLVLMESMTAGKLGHFGNPDGLTPVLDSLYGRSLGFDRIFSAGIHTMNGIYSTLYSFPALLRQHPMNKIPIPKMAGLPTILKSNGYSTAYFTTHDDQFDNVGGFLSANDVENIFAQKDYPSEMVKSTLGVPDHYMFEFSIPKLNQLHQKGKPFLASYMTASDHGPYILPTGIPFKAKNEETRKAIVEYADWSIGHFLNLASREPWFNETIFVFIADHGQMIGESNYDVPLNFTHVPLIMYAPSILKPQIYTSPGGQIDVGPTLLGLLGISYYNNTLGVDMLKSPRPCMYFNFDDKIGVLDTAWYYIHRIGGQHGLYRYVNEDPQNYLIDMPEKGKFLSDYGLRMMQMAQQVLKQKQTGPVPEIFESQFKTARAVK